MYKNHFFWTYTITYVDVRLLNWRVNYYLLLTHMATEAFLISLRCGADDPRREDGRLVSSALLRCNSRIPVACSRYRRVMILTTLCAFSLKMYNVMNTLFSFTLWIHSKYRTILAGKYLILYLESKIYKKFSHIFNLGSVGAYFLKCRKLLI